MIDEIIALLRQTPLFQECRVVERDQAPDGTFILKVRCKLRGHLKFQLRIKNGADGTRYSYQLFDNATTMIRWDNAPHFQDLDNFPHHCHTARGNTVSSALTGDVLDDLSFVLLEVEKNLGSKT